jgi:acyl carrier protein phosphodiesterase
MNFLAHVFLSHHSPEAILGAMLGDFVKGSVGAEYPPAVREAIVLHRTIDRFTDAHPIPYAARALVSPARRRFAPILIDVFYDHFLARYWADYCTVPLPQFAQQVYDVLRANRAILPPRLQIVAPRMVANDWLTAYAELPGVDAAVNGIARRLERYPRAAALHGAAEELERHYARFERDFRTFFPQLTAYAASLLGDKQAA